MLILTTILIFLIGLAIGSFVNVLVFRTHDEQSFIKSRSKCRKCEEPINWYDLIPILSYILLKRRCRRCQVIIEWQYPLIELVTGIFLAFLYLRYAHGWFLPSEVTNDVMWTFLVRDFLAYIYLLIIFVYDLRYKLILDRFSVSGMIALLLVNLMLGVSPLSMILGFVILGGFFALQYIVSKHKWVGGGDIRMGALMGVILGIEKGILALFLAYVFGAFFGIILLIFTKAGMKYQLPFAVFLAPATLFALIFGNKIIAWYLSLF